MSQGESLIAILLAVIAYLLYIIAKQLSHITGVRIKFPFGEWTSKKSPKQKPLPKIEEEKKLTN